MDERTNKRVSVADCAQGKSTDSTIGLLRTQVLTYDLCPPRRIRPFLKLSIDVSMNER